MSILLRGKVASLCLLCLIVIKRHAAIQGCYQLLDTKWLGDIVIHPGLETSLTVSLHSNGGHGNDAGALMALQPTRRYDQVFWKELMGGKEKKSKEQNLKELGF